MPPAITVENLSKVYRLGVKEASPDTLASAVTGMVRAPLRNLQRLRNLSRFKGDEDSADTLWALKDVSFEVPEGEVLGVIGRNGAGKSTLLKILSRITEPTSGRAVIRGRVSSLLEVGTGFHPELTGRDNIYMNGTILGMTKREIDRKFDEIVDFSGVERFLDTPIKRYSSGMQVRLAFSVAAHLEPEILIIDEVLAVGDAEFQKKCLGKMQDVAKGGRTALFVSHNMAAVEALCTHGIELQSGRIVSARAIQDVIADYRRSILTNRSPSYSHFEKARYIVRVAMFDAFGEPSSVVPIGKDMEVRMAIAKGAPVAEPRIFVHIADMFGTHLLTVQSPASGDVIQGAETKSEIVCRIHDFPLAPGQYSLTVSIMKHREIIERHRDCLRFSVENADLFNDGRGFARGICVARSSWSVQPATIGELIS